MVTCTLPSGLRYVSVLLRRTSASRRASRCASVIGKGISSGVSSHAKPNIIPESPAPPTSTPCAMSGDCYVDIPRIIRQTVREVGYTRAKFGFDAETCGVVTSIDEQSPDIAQGVDVGGAGDSGMMFGFACDETPELMPLPITLAHRLAR